MVGVEETMQQRPKKRFRTVTVWLSAEEYELLRGEAMRLGLSLSSYFRLLLHEKLMERRSPR